MKLNKISIDLIKNIHELVTNHWDTVDVSIQYGQTNDGEFLKFSAKTSRDTSPVARITFQDGEAIVSVTVPPSFNHITGKHSDDYFYFSEVNNRVYTEEEFKIANRNFWFNHGKYGLDL